MNLPNPGHFFLRPNYLKSKKEKIGIPIKPDEYFPVWLDDGKTMTLIGEISPDFMWAEDDGLHLTNEGATCLGTVIGKIRAER